MLDHSRTLGLLSLLALVTAPAAVTPASAGAVTLAPHRAIYDISLGNARAGTGMTELSGRMVYEITGNRCEGYTQNMRFVTRTTNQEGTVSISDLRSSTWEEGSGERFRFSSSQYRDDQLSEQTSGEAVRRKGAGLRVELAKPKKKVVNLPAGALFPIQHSLHLIAAAQDGRRVFTSDLFDASDKADKAYATTAFIGKPYPAGFNRQLPAVAHSEVLNDLQSWPISLSYYDKSKSREDAVPSYELAVVFFENGVSRRLYIDYGEFSIKGELKELTFLEAAKCDLAKK
jgi:hypothetical protein